MSPTPPRQSVLTLIKKLLLGIELIMVVGIAAYAFLFIIMMYI